MIRSASPASPSAAILAGVSATANSARVALLTPASVACADSTTATSSVNGLTYSSSLFGSGLAAASRAKISSARASSAAFAAPAGGGGRGMRPDCLAPCAPYSRRRPGRQAAASPGRLLWTQALTPTTLRSSPRGSFRAARSRRRRRAGCSRRRSSPARCSACRSISPGRGRSSAFSASTSRCSGSPSACSFRAARAYEDYRLTYLELEFARVSARGARREWRFNPAWVTLERGDDGAAARTAGAAQRRPPARDRVLPRPRRKGGVRRRSDPRAGRSAAGAAAVRRIQNAACRLISSSTRLFSSGVRLAVAASRSGSSMPAALAKRFQVAASTRSLGTPRPLT